MLSYRTSGVVNFAHAATGMYVAYAYFEFRETGVWVAPWPGLPHRVTLLPGRPTLVTALAFGFLLAAVLGVAIYWLVFRPLRRAPALARVVASLGLLLYLQETCAKDFASGTAFVRREALLPDDPVRLLGTSVSADRLLLAAIAVAVATALALLFRFTRFGLATRASAESEKGALLLGLSPDRVAVLNWAIATVLAGGAVVLIQPIAGLDPLTTSFLVVPALGAALFGNLRSFAGTTAAGLSIGIVQSVVLKYVTAPGTTWIPAWVPDQGVVATVPVIVILAVLALRGNRLPTRGELVERRLPPSPTPRRVLPWMVGLGAIVVAGLLALGADWRHAIISSLLFSLLALSFVVPTGYAGQISVAQLSLAGIAAFTLTKLTDVPFPIAPLIAAFVATAVGVAVALPIMRIRGMSLAIATLAIASAIEALVLNSTSFSGGVAGVHAPPLEFAGIDLGISARGADNFRAAFGVVVLVVLAVAAVAVANLRRTRTGLRWLATRANERAGASTGVAVTETKLLAFAVSSFLAGLYGAMLAYALGTISPSSFLVQGALVALALTYLQGISSISGALVAGLAAQTGVLTVGLDKLISRLGGADGVASEYVFVVSGLLLIVTAIVAPEGVTGIWREQTARVTARIRVRRAGREALPAVEAGTER